MIRKCRLLAVIILVIGSALVGQAQELPDSEEPVPDTPVTSTPQLSPDDVTTPVPRIHTGGYFISEDGLVRLTYPVHWFLQERSGLAYTLVNDERLLHPGTQPQDIPNSFRLNIGFLPMESLFFSNSDDIAKTGNPSTDVMNVLVELIKEAEDQDRTISEPVYSDQYAHVEIVDSQTGIILLIFEVSEEIVGLIGAETSPDQMNLYRQDLFDFFHSAEFLGTVEDLLAAW